MILLTLDSSKYPDDKDKQIAKNALKSRKPVFLLLNKSDLGESLPDEEFLRLGIKPDATFRISATTGQGIKDLKSAILKSPHWEWDSLFLKRIRRLGRGRAARPRNDGRHERAS